MLAVYPTLVGAELMLNELAEVRADLLSRLFPEIAVSCHDAASINDRLPAAIRPTVVLMNPPFSAVAHVDRRMQDRSEEHTSELQSLMRISYAVFCLKKKKKQTYIYTINQQIKYTTTIHQDT